MRLRPCKYFAMSDSTATGLQRQAARALACLDLTSLNLDDTPERIDALCDRALSPAPGIEHPSGRCLHLSTIRRPGSCPRRRKRDRRRRRRQLPVGDRIRRRGDPRGTSRRSPTAPTRSTSCSRSARTSTAITSPRASSCDRVADICHSRCAAGHAEGHPRDRRAGAIPTRSKRRPRSRSPTAPTS